MGRRERVRRRRPRPGTHAKGRTQTKGVWSIMKAGRKQSTLLLGAVSLVVTLLVLLAGGLPSGLAQGQPPAAGYALGPGDVLEISVWGYPELTRLVTIGPDGKISLPLVGSVSTAGTSVERLTSDLTLGYSEYIVNPQVTVSVKEFRKIHVSTLGQVTHPGAYDLPPDARILDLIAAAGGMSDQASQTQAQLLRPGQAPVTVDLARVLGGDPDQNVLLRGGETLVIPEDLVDFVNVEGEVVHPGRYRLKGQEHILDVLLEAGGLTDHASVVQAKLVRTSGASQSLNLDDLLLHENMNDNIALQGGDTIFVPVESNNKIYVVGDVNSPGVFTVHGPVTMLEAIAMAGGPVQRGPTGTAQSAYILHRGAQQGVLAGPASTHPAPAQQEIQAGPPGTATTSTPQGTITSTNLQALLHNAPGTPDLPVDPGDVVVVPQTKVGNLQPLLDIVQILSNIAFIFRF